ncbi:MAG: SMP-30/gluconolactonase/LRE family protein [Ginsengibacter sp.]
MKFVILLFLTAIMSNANAQSKNDFDNQSSPVVADHATLQLISNQFTFTEGPATDKEGNVFFTDQPNNKIWKYDTNGKLSVFLSESGRSNGMFFDKDGNLISCADEHNQLWSISPEKKITVLVKDFNGIPFNGPNDVYITPDGKIYFTDPYYQRTYWTRKSPEMKHQNVYYLDKKRNPVIVITDLKKPNGLIGTPDGKYLYVADIKDNKTYKYRIADDGSLKEATFFAPQGSDGMTIDSEGNIYLTGNGITVYNAEGKQIWHIDVPADWTGNVTFAGKERNILFITASQNIYTLKMKVKGVQ